METKESSSQDGFVRANAPWPGGRGSAKQQTHLRRQARLHRRAMACQGEVHQSKSHSTTNHGSSCGNRVMAMSNATDDHTGSAAATTKPSSVADMSATELMTL